MIRSRRVARQTAIRARTQTINASRRCWSPPRPSCASSCGTANRHPGGRRGRPGPRPDHQPTGGGQARAGHLAHRHQALNREIKALTTELDRLTATAAPKLVALFGIGQDNAGPLLVAAGDNPQRLRSEACFAMLGGSSPIPASSGKTVRHRLNRGGDRQANAALYRIVLVRLRYHQPTKDYLTRRLAEGKPKNEIIRCLKRYIAREVFAALQPLRHELLTPPS